MAKLEPMDILQAPSPEEVTYAKIVKWILIAKPDENQIGTITFKKDTPKNILKLFEKNINLFPYKVHKKYFVEK